MATKYIDNISFPRLTHAYHVAFFSNVKAGIDKYEYDKLGIDDENYARFCEALEREQDIVKRSRASALTKELADNDQKRDNYFRRIFYKLKECTTLYQSTSTVTKSTSLAPDMQSSSMRCIINRKKGCVKV